MGAWGCRLRCVGPQAWVLVRLQAWGARGDALDVLVCLLIVGEQVEEGYVEDAEAHDEAGGEGAVGEVLVREDPVVEEGADLVRGRVRVRVRVRVTVRVRVRVRVGGLRREHGPRRSCRAC